MKLIDDYKPRTIRGRLVALDGHVDHLGNSNEAWTFVARVDQAFDQYLAPKLSEEHDLEGLNRRYRVVLRDGDLLVEVLAMPSVGDWMRSGYVISHGGRWAIEAVYHVESGEFTDLWIGGRSQSDLGDDLREYIRRGSVEDALDYSAQSDP